MERIVAIGPRPTSFSHAEILRIARRKRVFVATWSSERDLTLRKCKELVKQGKLVGGYRGQGVSEFHPVRKAAS